MPVDHSPPRGTSNTTDGDRGENPTTPSSTTQQVFPLGSGDIDVAGGGRDQTERSPAVQAHEFRNVKLPTFWQKRPKLWFVQLESEFVIYRIRSGEIKYSSVVRHLDEHTMLAVADILETPPSANRYQQLKEALIARFTDSEEKRLRQLIAGVELGDKKNPLI
jgi:hypothetical protein